MLSQLPEPFQSGFLTPLAQGHTNQVFRLTCQSHDYFLRIPSKNTNSLNIARLDEQTILTLVAEHQLTPKIHYFDAAGILIQSWIEEAIWQKADFYAPDKREQLIKQIYSIHQLTPNVRRFDLATNLESWRASVKCDDSELKSVYRLLFKWLKTHENYSSVFCHNDLNPGNLLGAKPWIIDWEYAAYHDPAFEFAVIAEYAGFSAQEISVWIDIYNAAGGCCDPSRMNAMRLYVCFLGYFWYMKQASLTGDEVMFQEADIFACRIKKSMLLHALN